MSEQKSSTKFTLINLTDEIKKVDPQWESEFEFHKKYSYPKEKNRNARTVADIRYKIDQSNKEEE